MSSKITASSQGQASHEGALRTPQNENKLGTSIILFVVCMALFLGAIFSVLPHARQPLAHGRLPGAVRPGVLDPADHPGTLRLRRRALIPVFLTLTERPPGQCPGGLPRLVHPQAQNQMRVQASAAAATVVQWVWAIDQPATHNPTMA
jgi:hypothetical protein